jgi:hypothetical protein
MGRSSDQLSLKGGGQYPSQVSARSMNSVANAEGSGSSNGSTSGRALRRSQQLQHQQVRPREPRERKGNRRARHNQNANHLLNFVHPELSTPQSHEEITRELARSQPRRRRSGSQGQQYAYTSQAQYMHAAHHYLLLPKDGGHAYPCMVDPDSPVDWNSVDVVVLSSGAAGDWNCPICLYAPVCPRLTKCGHLFCFSCILRHFCEDRHGRCPMCYARSEVGELRGVMLKPSTPVDLGRSVHFSLLRRSRSSLVPVPASQDLQYPEVEHPVEGEPCSQYARIVVAAPAAVLNRAAGDDCILKKQREECLTQGDTEALPFITQAREMLAQRIKSLTTSGLNAGVSVNVGMMDFSSVKVSASDSSRHGSEPPKVASMLPVAESQAFSFYQLSDGLSRAFLHPLSMRCLLEEAGQNPLSLPAELEATVVEVESVRLTHDVRRRYPFLGHLPEHCLVDFVELDLRYLLSSATLEKYGAELTRRHQRRRSIARERERERVEEERASAEMQERMAALRLATVDLNGPPPWAAAEEVNGQGCDAACEEVSMSTSCDSSNAPRQPETPKNTPSFAKVILGSRQVPSVVDDFPVLGATRGAGPARISTSMAMPTWGNFVNTPLTKSKHPAAAAAAAEAGCNADDPRPLKSKKRASRGISLLSNAGARGT